MGVRVKICGLAHPDDVLAVAECGPDAMGFVFWPRSKRAVTPKEVGRWTAGLSKSILRVGVFVDATPDEIRRVMDEAGLDVAQLHGREPPDLFANFERPLWRSVALRDGLREEIERWHVDAFLIDTYSAESPGGTGQVSDWRLARMFVESCARSVWLAGGLTPENVSAAIHEVGPWGVDVSSGVEREPGRKDITKVKAFIEACREA